MSFTELTFVFILIPLSVISALLLKWLKNEKIRNTVILILSIGIFAYYSRKALIFLSFFIVLTYLLGNLVYESRKGETKKKKWLVLSLISLVAVLVYCKYIPAILKWWNKFDIHTISYVSLVSLTGISFLVFSAISYIVDIHRGDAKPGSFIESALFITFFPKFTSGPIVLWKDFSSVAYHFYEHGEEVGATDISQYLRKADGFKANLRGAHKSYIEGYVDGVIRYSKNGKYIDLAPDGSIISFGKQ